MSKGLEAGLARSSNPSKHASAIHRMAYPSISVLPVLDVSKMKTMKKASVATLTTDLTSLFATLDAHISDLVCFTALNRVG